MDTNEQAATIAASIASAGTAEWKPPAPAAQPTEAATTEVNQEQKPSEAATPETPATPDSQPTEEGKKVDESATPEAKAEGKKVSSLPEKSSKSIEIADKPEENSEEKLLREALGLKVEDDTPEVIRSKYEASSKEAHRLVEEAKAKAEALAEAGVELVLTKEGKFALKANDKYLDTLNDLPDIYSKLSEEDQGLVTKEVAAKIVKAAMAEALPKRPVVKAASVDKVLDEREIQGAFDTLAAEKLPNGQPRYADIGEDTTVKLMRELYDRPNAEGFRNCMNQSSENFKEGLSMLHAQVFRVRAPLLAAKKDAEAAKLAKETELKKKPATVASGSGVKPDAMRHTGTPNGANDPAKMAEMIAKADYR